jgi:hypothetical protein
MCALWRHGAETSLLQVQRRASSKRDACINTRSSLFLPWTQPPAILKWFCGQERRTAKRSAFHILCAAMLRARRARSLSMTLQRHSATRQAQLAVALWSAALRRRPAPDVHAHAHRGAVGLAESPAAAGELPAELLTPSPAPPAVLCLRSPGVLQAASPSLALLPTEVSPLPPSQPHFLPYLPPSSPSYFSLPPSISPSYSLPR